VTDITRNDLCFPPDRHHGRDYYSKTAKRRSRHYAAEIPQKNCAWKSDQRCVARANIKAKIDWRPVLRERYLRDDVACGVQNCRACVTPTGQLPPLSVSGGSPHSQFTQGHFVLPDTNVFLSQVCNTKIPPGLLYLNTR
jgi:hypothetical protein